MGRTDWGKLGLVLMGGAMHSKSLIQFSIDGTGCACCLAWGQIDPPTSPLRLLDIHRQVRLSLPLASSQVPWRVLCLLDPQVGKSVVGPRTFLTMREFLWYNCSAVCGSSAQRLYGGATSSKRAYAKHWVTQVCCSQSPCPHDRPLLTRAPAGDTQTLKGRSGSVWSWSWTVLGWPTRPSRTNTKKRCPFHHRGLECKSRKSRDTWSNRQVWPWSTEWSRTKANRVLPRECTGHSKHSLPTTQEKTLHMDITRWSTLKSDWLCSL